MKPDRNTPTYPTWLLSLGTVAEGWVAFFLNMLRRWRENRERVGVLAKNHIAHGLYQQLGFNDFQVQMVKDL